MDCQKVEDSGRFRLTDVLLAMHSCNHKEVLLALYKARVVVLHSCWTFSVHCEVAPLQSVKFHATDLLIFTYVCDFLDSVYSCLSVFSCSNCTVRNRSCASCWYWNISVWLASGWWLMISSYNSYYYHALLVLFLVTVHKMFMYACFFSVGWLNQLNVPGFYVHSACSLKV